jgi:hypothetical protein
MVDSHLMRRSVISCEKHHTLELLLPVLNACSFGHRRQRPSRWPAAQQGDTHVGCVQAQQLGRKPSNQTVLFVCTVR